MDPNTGITKEADVTGSGLNDKPTGRRQSAFNRRKSSAVADEAPAAIVEASALNAADRRLAEMGYVQVSHALQFIWRRMLTTHMEF